MRTAVILLWASCLYNIARSVLCLIWAASPWRRLLVLTVLLLAGSCAHKPKAPLNAGACGKNDK